jgi:hypothetical protein
VLAQPGGERVGFAAGQHVHRPVGVHVDQDRVIGVAAADREVVDTEHLDVFGDGAQGGRGSAGSARHGSTACRALLGERRLRATGLDALEPAYLHHDLNTAPADRQVGKPTQVAGMDSARP